MLHTKTPSLTKTFTFNPYHIHTCPRVCCTYKQIQSETQIHAVTFVTCEQLCVAAAISFHLASACYTALPPLLRLVFSQTDKHIGNMLGRGAEPRSHLMHEESIFLCQRCCKAYLWGDIVVFGLNLVFESCLWAEACKSLE